MNSWIHERVNCCACHASMKNSKHINLVQTGKKATWQYPTAGNVLTGQPCVEAVAVLCDQCFEGKKQPELAVEWDRDGSVVVYHPIAALEPLEPSTDEEDELDDYDDEHYDEWPVDV